MTTGPLPRMTTHYVGDLRVDALVDCVSPTRPASELLREFPSGIVEANRGWLVPDYMEDDTDRLILAYQSFLIQMPGHNILVDCAVGEDGNFPARPDWHQGKSDWLNQLGLAGLAPEDIDIVFLTHLHMDHTGWLTRRHGNEWRPTFANARHLVSEAELAFWTARHGEFPYMSSSILDCVEPVLQAGLVETVAAGDEIAPGLYVVDLAGHSPGMIGLEFRPNGETLAAFNADLMHHPLQMTSPGTSTLFCADPAAAATIRRRKLEEYCRAGTLIFCGHFPGECAGYVESRSGGYALRRA